MTTLRDLLDGVRHTAVHGDLDVEIGDIAYHSGKVTPGGLFFCIRGYQTDGHKWLPKAVEAGAVAAIVEEHQPVADAVTQVVVPGARKAMALIAANYHGRPADRLQMFAVTATNGKTSTSFMIDSIWRAAGIDAGLIGTVVIKAGDQVIPAELTTPESMDLQAILADMLARGITRVTMEVSSSAMELDRVYGINYGTVVFNNLSHEHLDLHGGYEQYAAVKSTLVTGAAADAVAVLNADSPEVISRTETTAARRLVYSVETGEAPFGCENLDLSTGFAKFDVVVRGDAEIGGRNLRGLRIPVALKVPGYHSVYNAMAATVVALADGVAPEVIQRGLAEFAGVERRFECVHDGEFKIFDDHFANQGNIDVTLSTLTKMEYQDLQLVYAIRGSRGPMVNRENAEKIVEWAPRLGLRRLVVTRGLPYAVGKDLVTDEEYDLTLQVLGDAGLELDVHDDLVPALAEGLRRAGPGDVLLLAGCQGMDHGANQALKLLAERYPQLPRDELFAPLAGRVAGMD